MTDELTVRALHAYFREGRVASDINPRQRSQPTDRSGVRSLDGKDYVVLHNDVHGVLAVYRVRNDGKLKNLKRWPTELEQS